MKDILDIHSHTIASGHAYNTLYEMARAAADNGMELFGSSDHGPALPGSSHEMYFCNFKSIPKELFGMRLIMGCELNILDYKGTLDLKEWLLKRIDYGIASIHDLCYKTGSREENTAAAVNAMKSPYVQVIGHPDNANIPLDYTALVKGAREHHALLEVNNSSLKPGSPRPGAKENYYVMLDLCRKYNVSVIVSSDSLRIGCRMPQLCAGAIKRDRLSRRAGCQFLIKKIGRISSLPVTVHPCLQLSRELLQANN